jgi:hypothetical protein
MEMFNRSRYSYEKHPYTLYRNKATMLKLFNEDAPEFDPETGKRLPAIDSVTKKPIKKPMDLITPKLPDILHLYDDIRAAVPSIARELDFDYGRIKLTGKARERAGSPKHKDIKLPFNGKTVGHRVSNGWVLPMLAAFRANVDWDLDAGRFEWLVPLDKLFPLVIKDLVAVCISQHRAHILPEEVAAKESSSARAGIRVGAITALLSLLASDASLPLSWALAAPSRCWCLQPEPERILSGLNRIVKSWLHYQHLRHEPLDAIIAR